MGDNASLGQWLKQRRKELDLTQEDLAEHVGCSGEMIRKIEAGKRRPSEQMAQSLAECLGVPPGEHAAFVQLLRDPHMDLGTQAPISKRYKPGRVSASSVHTNLPIQATPFISRERETEAVRTLLWRTSTRLLTLTGTGGTGKTRLALHVAGQLIDDYADGVFFVPLATISDPALVTFAIAQSVGVEETVIKSLGEALQDHLRDKRMLLLLDNFEQVTAAAPLVGKLLSTASNLKVLVTSRAALHIYGEHEFHVPPMALPDTGNLPALEYLVQYDSVRLFIERAQAAKPDFNLTRENAQVVAEICRRVDGLPLAIELAAARIKLLPPQAMMARLEHRLPLLTGGAQDRPARHQALRNAIEWSYGLLAQDERTLFSRLGLFVGGCTLEAAQDVCSPPPAPLQIDLLDGMASLVDKSLLNQEASKDEPRFYMLETIREFALECLVANGEGELIQRRFAEFFLELAERAEPELDGPEQIMWLEQLEQEHDNLRAVLRWSEEGDKGETERSEVGLRMGAALWFFWFVRGYKSEGRRWLDRALSRAPQGDSLPPHLVTAKAWALHGAGRLAASQNDYQQAVSFLEESLTLSRSIDYLKGIANSLDGLSWIAYHRGDYALATTLAEEELALYRKAGDQGGIAWAISVLGYAAYGQGDLERSRAMLEQSLSLSKEAGHKGGIPSLLVELGEVVRAQGDYAAARPLYEEALALFHEQHRKRGIATTLANLGSVEHNQGNYAKAEALFRESLVLSQELGDRYCIAQCEVGLAGVWAARRTDADDESQHDAQKAANLLGAADALLDAIGSKLDLADRIDYDRNAASVRLRLGQTVWEAAWAKGRTMSLEQAIAFSLGKTQSANP